MAQKDTQLLGEILNVQKAILSKMNEQEKKDKEKDKKGGASEEAKVEAQGFLGMISELQNLNKTASEQLEVLREIKESIGGLGTSGGSSNIKVKGGFGESVGELGAGLVSLGLGILAVVGGIAAMALIAPIVPLAVVGAIGVGIIVWGFFKIFETVGEEKTSETVDRGLENLYKMAGGLALFTLAVVASGLALGAVGFAPIAGVALTVAAFAGLFFILGKGADTIKDGAQAAVWMGLGMAAVGLGVLAMIWSLKQAGDIVGEGGGSVVAGAIAGFAVLAISAATFYILGQFDKQIIKGAMTAAYIGLGLVAFGVGVTIYLLGISKVMGVGGGAEKQPEGPFEAIGSMLAGMGVIAAGAITLALYGTVFSLLGVLQEAGIPELAIPPGTPLAGALGFALIGLSLLVFGFGFDYYMGKTAKWMGVGSEKGLSEKLSIQSMIGGYMATQGGLMNLLLVGTIFAAAGLAAPLILIGAAAIALSGLALISIATGIETFMEKVPPGTQIGEELKTNLVSIRDAFLAFVGQEKLGQGGIFDTLGGMIKGGATAGTLAGAIATSILIGPALSSIAQGLSVWSNITQAPKIIGYDEHGQPIFDPKGTVNLLDSIDNINEFLPKVLDPFIELSKKANLEQKDSLLSLVTGINLGMSPFARGVSIAGEIGPVLSSLAQGVGAFANVKQAPKFTGYDSKGQPIYSASETVDLFQSIDNIKETIEKVIEPFIDLANRANLTQAPNLLSVLIGLNLSESPFSRGVSIAGNIGAVLSSLAQGVGAFNNVQQAPKFVGYDDKGQPIYDKGQTVNLFDSIDNIQSTIEKVIEPFVNLANSAALNQPISYLSILTGINFAESPFSRGVSIVGKIGNVLSSLAQGIGVFANLSQAPKIEGYDEHGNPKFASAGTIDVIASMGNLAEVLSTDSDNSIIKPFIDLAESAAMQKPFSLGGFIAEALIGVNPSASPLEKGITLGLQIGEIISNVGRGIGQMANLAAIPVIKSYDKEGRPIYGEPINALNSVANFGKIMGDLIIAFADAARRAGPYADPEELEAIGPTIGGILGAVADSLDTFSNPNKIKKIKGYDEKGRPIYYENEFVDIDQVISTMNDVVLKIIKAFGTEEVEDAMDNLDIDEDEMIGDYLAMFLKPISGFSKIVGELNGKGQNLYSLTDEIIYSTLTFIKRFGDLDYDAIDNMESAGEALSDFSEYIVSSYEDLLEFDQSNPGFFKTDTNPQGSALRGVSENLAHSVSTIASAFAPDSTMPQLETALEGSEIVEDILINMKAFPNYMKLFLAAKPKEFGDGAKAAFDGLFIITKVAKDGEGAGKTHMKLFTDQMNRLANIATPFEKFANAFGKMSRDMGVFAENFSLMDERGIMAFKEWTDSIVTLSTANPDTFAANVVTANKAIDAGFNAGEDEGIVDTIVNAFTGDDKTKGEKQEIINNNTTPQKPGTGGTPVKMPTAAEIGAAVANALTGKTIDVFISGKKTGLVLSK